METPRVMFPCEDVKVFFAPEGVLWIEEGVYVAEERNNKNVSKNKYLQAAEKSWQYHTLSHHPIWGFPQMGVSPNHPFKWDFPL